MCKCGGVAGCVISVQMWGSGRGCDQCANVGEWQGCDQCANVGVAYVVYVHMRSTNTPSMLTN